MTDDKVDQVEIGESVVGDGLAVVDVSGKDLSTPACTPCASHTHNTCTHTTATPGVQSCDPEPLRQPAVIHVVQPDDTRGTPLGGDLTWRASAQELDQCGTPSAHGRAARAIWAPRAKPSLARKMASKRPHRLRSQRHPAPLLSGS